MKGKLLRHITARQFQVHEEHAHCKLIPVQHPIVVNVGQVPYPAKDAVGQLGLEQLLPHCRPSELALGVGPQLVKHGVVLGNVLADEPPLLTLGSGRHLVVPGERVEGFIVATAKYPSLDTSVSRQLLLLRQHVHEFEDVGGQHVVHGLQELHVELLEGGKVVLHQLRLHLLHRGKVPCRNIVPLVQCVEHNGQLLYELLLL